jgi:hypothetical protein
MYPPELAPKGVVARVSHWPRRTLITLGIIIGVLAVARLAAPFLVKRAINQRLAKIPDYSGHVDSVALHVWRGAYRMEGFRIVKSSGKVSEPFFAAERIDFSIAWSELIHGRLVSSISIRNAELNFERGATEENSQLTADSRWQDVINDLFPIDITFLDIRGGTLRFVDTTETPRVDIAVKDLSVTATGLRNRPEDTETIDPLPAKVDISGITIGEGRFRLYAKIEPLADKPHFELATELNKVALPALNPFLQAYADVEVSKGQFDVVAQMAMKDGHYEGYVKPFLSDLRFDDVPGQKESLGHHLWKGLVSGVANLVKNKDSKQVATRLPFSGDANKFDIHTWKTIENTMHHGFIKALPLGFEGTTHPDGTTPDSVPAEKPIAPKS